MFWKHLLRANIVLAGLFCIDWLLTNPAIYELYLQGRVSRLGSYINMHTDASNYQGLRELGGFYPLVFSLMIMYVLKYDEQMVRIVRKSKQWIVWRQRFIGVLFCSLTFVMLHNLVDIGWCLIYFQGDYVFRGTALFYYVINFFWVTIYLLTTGTILFIVIDLIRNSALAIVIITLFYMGQALFREISTSFSEYTLLTNLTVVTEFFDSGIINFMSLLSMLLFLGIASAVSYILQSKKDYLRI
jgi:hypothetical protein